MGFHKIDGEEEVDIVGDGKENDNIVEASKKSDNIVEAPKKSVAKSLQMKKK